MLQQYDLIIHIGAGYCPELEEYISSKSKQILLIDADTNIATQLKRRVSSFSHVTVLNELVSANNEACKFYQYSVNKFSSIFPASNLFELYPHLKLITDKKVIPIGINDIFKQYILKHQAVMVVIDVYGQSGSIINELSQSGIPEVIKTIKIIDFAQSMYDRVPLETEEALGAIGFYPQIMDHEDPEISSITYQLNPLYKLLKIQQQENLDLQNKIKEQAELVQDQDSLLQTINQRFKHLENRLIKQTKLEANNVIKQLQSHNYLQNFFVDDPAIFDFHGWPISADFGALLIRLLQKKHYDLVIEFGSGTSTVLMAKAVKQIYAKQKNKPFIVSFDHLKQYANQTNEMLAAAGVNDVAKVLLAPLTQYDNLVNQDAMYYDSTLIFDALHSYQTSKELSILVVVDGPPESTCNSARYPALPILISIFNYAKLDILMDDANRASEQQIITLWEGLLANHNTEYTITKFDVEKGAALISTIFVKH